MKIFVIAKPGAKQEKIEQTEANHFTVWVKEPATENKANQAIISALADFFDVPKSSVSIISGLKSKQKTVEIK